jgi:error-prone DNA polymerase
MSGFVHLQVHSHYSLMRGASSIEELCAAAGRAGMRALALTDVNGLYGAVRFWEAARQAELEPILGADVRPAALKRPRPGLHPGLRSAPRPAPPLAPRSAPRRADAPGGVPAGAPPGAEAGAAPGAAEEERAVLLVRTPEGYARLCQILSRLHLGLAPDGEPGPFRLREELRRDRAGLVVITSSLPLLRALAEARGERTPGRPPGAAETDDLFLALEPGRRDPERVRAGRRLGVAPLAVNDVTFAAADGFARHRLLRAIDLHTTLDRLPAAELAARDSWLLAPSDMERRFPHCPEALERASDVAAACRAGLPDPPWGRLVLPRYRDLEPAEAAALLRRRAEEGARRRYGTLPGGALRLDVRARLERELEIIAARGFAAVFLIVADIVARSPRTCGRGSAAASLVSYCLGITHVEPLAHRLMFERFLNPARRDPPDIDVDFCWDERDAVLQHVLSAHGEERTAMIANHVTLRARAAVREVAKVFGLPDADIARVSRRLARVWGGDCAEIVRTHPLFRGACLEEPWPRILAEAAALEGTPRHLSVHCGGVVIVPDRIERYAPVERAAKGVRVLQWEKDQAEDAGLVKIDLLGNRSLSVVRDCIAAVNAAARPTEAAPGPGAPSGAAPAGRVAAAPAPPRGAGPLTFERLDPLRDPAACELMRRGDTMGVFYVESPAMRLLQQKTGRGDFQHLVIHSSIIRPAANEYIREYVRRLRGGAWKSLHPILDEILQETHGIMVYQEDVARVAMRMGGFDAGEADGLRKVLARKWAGRRLEDYRQRFCAGARARGVAGDVVQEVWRMILSFSGYSFCKPHSASYALLSYKSAFFKARHPGEFMAAVITNQGGYYSTFAYVSEARRMGLRVLPPDVNASERAWTGRGREVRCGLMQVQGLRREALERLLAERRRGGPFRSFADFLRRAAPDPADAARLVRAGCFDALERGCSRPDLLWRLRAWQARRAPAGLFEPELPPLPRARPYDEARALRDEVEALGFLLSRHPLTLYGDSIARLRPVAGRDLGRHAGREVTAIGWLVTGKIVETRAGEPMEFLSFEDTTAIYETTFFPDAYARFCGLLTRSRPFVLRGRVEEDFGAVTLTVREAAPLRAGAAAAPAAGPRRSAGTADRRAARDAAGRSAKASPGAQAVRALEEILARRA